MSSRQTPTFIHELPLRVDHRQAHALMKRFDVMHFPYNVVLQEMLRRLDAMRADPGYAVARALSTEEDCAARAATFATLRKQYGFSEFAAHEVVARHLRASHSLTELIDSHTAQTLATRAFNACQQYAFGARGRLRFKRRGSISSVEGKGPTSPLNWRDDHVVWGGKRRDRRLVLRPRFDRKDTKGVEAHALASKVKYVRLLRRLVRGEQRFFVQLVCAGAPKARLEPKAGAVGIDLGPSTAAIVSPNTAALVSFLPEIGEDLKAKRRLQRAMDRSRRATNPQCYHVDGTWKQGVRQTVFSAGYRALRARLAEQERGMAERRDRMHGRLSNLVLSEFGDTIKTEKLSKRAWQRRWGRRMKATAPASFMAKLRRKAENAGGGVVEFNARKYKLSQYDHTTNDYVKKPLSQREHALRDGSGVVQRDLYSAWLALFVDESQEEFQPPGPGSKGLPPQGWDACQAHGAWPVAHPLLAFAASHPVKAASRRPLAFARDAGSRQSGSQRKQHESAMRPTASAAGESRVTL